MNRYSYMFLDSSCDAVTASAYGFYRSAFFRSPSSSYDLCSLLHTLSLEGHALPLDEGLAEDIVSRLSLLSCRAASCAFCRLEPEIA